MGGAGSGRKEDVTKKILGELAKEQPYVLPAQDTIVLPNLSGDHSAGHTGTPIKNTDIANKAYVDSKAFSNGTASIPFSISAPGNVTTTGSYRHLGLGSTIHFTPTKSGIIMISLHGFGGGTGTLSSSNSGKLAYGTGAAPALNAAATGAQIPNTYTRSWGNALPAGTAPVPTDWNGIVVLGLSVGTAYWFDVQIQIGTGGGTAATMSSIEASITELPY